MPRPAWASLLSDNATLSTTIPCRCFFALESVLDDPDGPFKVDRRNKQWLGYNIVSLSGVQLVFCPRCGGRGGAWRDEVFDAHAKYRAARDRYDFLLGRLEPDVVAERCAALGAVPLGDSSDWGANWIDRDNHLTVSIGLDPDHDCFYGSCSFWPGPELTESPYRKFGDP